MFRSLLHRLGRGLTAFGITASLVLAVVDVRHARLLDLVQLNLCNSGWAGCYTGRSVAAAAALIRAEEPDVVTLNEICRGDARALGRDSGMSVSFQPAIDRRIGQPIVCRDGEPYGIGLLVRAPANLPARGGTYPIQDPGGPEGRAWLCAPVAGGLVACTTHLVSTNPIVALAQCRHFFAAAGAAFPGRRVVVGGDFNLGDLATCLPPRYVADSDGGVQHVAVVGPARTGRQRVIDMAGTTDHPALAVTWL
jgi:hypothetical protein